MMLEALASGGLLLFILFGLPVFVGRFIAHGDDEAPMQRLFDK